MTGTASPTLSIAPVDELARDVRQGLTRQPKKLPPHYFYDALGSALFDAICRLPWYEVTRAELRLLQHHKDEIVCEAEATFFTELGPGNGEKLTVLAREAVGIGTALAVHLIDLSPVALETAARAIGESGGVPVTTEVAPYEAGLRTLAEVRPRGARALLLLLGSNLGNFEPREAQAFLSSMRAALVPGDAILLGLDLVKPEDRLLLAYDDPLGVTAAFNKNLLVRLNRELDATFDLARYRHRARWDAEHARVEMHLVSCGPQHVDIPGAGLCVTFDDGESIWTESSHKFDPDTAVRLASRAGLSLKRLWIDEPGRFALLLLSV